MSVSIPNLSFLDECPCPTEQYQISGGLKLRRLNNPKLSVSTTGTTRVTTNASTEVNSKVRGVNFDISSRAGGLTGGVNAGAAAGSLGDLALTFVSTEIFMGSV